jgi:glycosyltransferase involved in cell wall biosynthesis
MKVVPTAHLINGDCASGVLISVVVPTYNRRTELLRSLEALWNQSLDKKVYEVIVACDGSTDGTIEAVRELQLRNWSLLLIELKNQGPASARNAGASIARGKVLAFTDDDCVVSPSWLQEILKAFQGTTAVALHGRTVTDQATRSPLTHEMEVLGPWLSTVPTCNAAFMRSAFEAAGRFDESFPTAHNEDRDLAWRVEELGDIIFAPEVIVSHPPRYDGLLKRARAVRLLQSDFILYYKHPKKYRAYISGSPWCTILWLASVIQQFEVAKSSAKYLIQSRRLNYCLQGVALIVARWLGLIWYLPSYFRASLLYRKKYAAASVRKAF